jgi:hypothetical protein
MRPAGMRDNGRRAVEGPGRGQRVPAANACRTMREMQALVCQRVTQHKHLQTNDSRKPGGLATYGRLLRYLGPLWPAFLVSMFGFALYALTQSAFAGLMQYLPAAFEGSTLPALGSVRAAACAPGSSAWASTSPSACATSCPWH